ncbi:hypothetical protein GCM10017600_37590 [Streptosporangium carneum]|uniref:Uncharacterized protein n=1 Tax=Streptosporangium carneum TaxID=47481 RepID=A0A9W6I290_9ACTN|nr:hypothetical protein GCM10017600_37590 [Streptosporangium carneum]
MTSPVLRWNRHRAFGSGSPARFAAGPGRRARGRAARPASLVGVEPVVPPGPGKEESSLARRHK